MYVECELRAGEFFLQAINFVGRKFAVIMYSDTSVECGGAQVLLIRTERRPLLRRVLVLQYMYNQPLTEGL